MINKADFSVSIRSGLNGPVMTEYDTEPGPITLVLWVPKPTSDGNDDWSFQIPGMNVLDTATKQLVGYEYHFADLEISNCDIMSAECRVPKGNDDVYLGSIWVSVRRVKVKAGLTPTSIASHTPPDPSQKTCRHSVAIAQKGIRHTIKAKQVAPFDMGTIVSDPKPEAFIDLENPEGRWMNSIFFFRPRERLAKVMNSGSESELPGSQPGQNTDIPPQGVKIATSEPTSSSTTLAPTAIKRRKQPRVTQNGAEESSSLHDTTSPKHKRPRRAVVIRSSDTQQHSVGSGPSKAKPHEVTNDASNEKDETEDVDGETEREQLLNAFTKQANQPKPSTKDRRNLPAPNPSPPSKTRSAKPDLSSILTKEYQKLREASNANRRSKQKNKHPPKSASISSNQSVESFTLRATIPETQFASMDQITPPQEDDRSGSTESSRLTSPAPAEEPALKPSISDLEIQTLRAKKARLQEQLKLKLQAECDELERQLHE
ncbi:hypothetical protein G7Y79_00004g013300 [Physcia stellaris]|nr:hypothetical protein G7Y79_00004g013300 [Physcia stellaris]